MQARVLGQVNGPASPPGPRVSEHHLLEWVQHPRPTHCHGSSAAAALCNLQAPPPPLQCDRFMVAFGFVTLVGAAIAAFPRRGIRSSRPFWVGLFAINAVLFMLASEAILAAWVAQLLRMGSLVLDGWVCAALLWLACWVCACLHAWCLHTAAIADAACCLVAVLGMQPTTAITHRCLTLQV